MKSTSWPWTCQLLPLQRWLRPSRSQPLKACAQSPCAHYVRCSVCLLHAWTQFNGRVYEGWNMENTWEKCLRPHSPLLFQLWLNDQVVAHIYLSCSGVLRRDKHLRSTPPPKEGCAYTKFILLPDMQNIWDEVRDRASHQGRPTTTYWCKNDHTVAEISWEQTPRGNFYRCYVNSGIQL